MSLSKKFEILEGLPTYGPMYISISENSIPFYHEGFVVRFFKNNNNFWIGNFSIGSTNFSTVFELTDSHLIVVIAKGQGYLVDIENEKATTFFGYAISEIIETRNNNFILANDTDIIIINSSGSIWRSERISWDGIKDLKLEYNSVFGLSYDPMNSLNEWVEFSINLETKEISGGSFRIYEFRNSDK